MPYIRVNPETCNVSIQSSAIANILVQRATLPHPDSNMSNDLRMVCSVARSENESMAVPSNLDEASTSYDLANIEYLKSTQDASNTTVATDSKDLKNQTSIEPKNLDSYRRITKQNIVTLSEEISKPGFSIKSFCCHYGINRSTMSGYYINGALTEKAIAKLQGRSLRAYERTFIKVSDLLALKDYVRHTPARYINVSAWSRHRGLKRTTLAKYWVNGRFTQAALKRCSLLGVDPPTI